MTIEDYRDYCLSKKMVTEHFPFDQDTLVFKVCGKMFALTSLKNWEAGEQFLNLKCDPDYAQELRDEYESIKPGYHMNKRHWNSVYSCHNDIPEKLLYELIDLSYSLVVKSLTKKQRELLL
ncbi:MAG: MmcQ/YjbR family DNA-binding protein [Flavobacteriaceae bacterium]